MSRRFVQSRAAVFLAAAALLLVLGWSGRRLARDTSATFDEPGFLAAGYSYLAPGAAQISTTNLRLAQLCLAAPLLPLKPHLPEDAQHANTLLLRQDVALGRAFLADPRNDSAAMLRASRAVTGIFGALLGGLLFVWSRRLHGNAAGLLTLALYCLDPLIMAHNALATTDLVTALAFALAVGAVWRTLHTLTLPTVGGAGLAVGALAATKLSSVLLPFIIAGMLLVRGLAGPPLRIGWLRPDHAAPRLFQLALLAGAAAVVCILAYVTLWAVYGFQTTVGTTPHEIWSVRPEHASAAYSIVDWARAHGLLPEAYLADVKDFLLRGQARRSFLWGDYSVDGWWYFFPVAWFFKTPLPMLLALALGGTVLGLACRRSRAPGAPSAVNLYGLTPLAMLALVYGLFALSGTLNIGLRHVLPVYPFLFVVAGLAVRVVPARPRARGLVAAGLFAWAGVEAARAMPHPMAYFNPFAGGSRDGYRVLVDSSYEWGQDLPALERWLDERARAPGAKPPVFFSYFGNNDLRRLAGRVTLLPQFIEQRDATAYPLQPGTFVISATMLQSVYGWAMGPWRPSLERAYQEFTAEMQRFQTHAGDPAALRNFLAAEGKESWGRKIRMFDDLRFARLCAMLRQRSPDARITPGLFVFELGYDDLKRALLDAPAELHEHARIKGADKIPPEILQIIP